LDSMSHEAKIEVLKQKEDIYRLVAGTLWIDSYHRVVLAIEGQEIPSSSRQGELFGSRRLKP